MEKITVKVPPSTAKKIAPKKKAEIAEDIVPKVEETVQQEIPLDQEGTFVPEENAHQEFVKKLKPEPHVKKSSDNIENSETIDLSAKNAGVDEDNNVKVNFMNNAFMGDFIEKESERSKDNEDVVDKGGKPGDTKTGGKADAKEQPGAEASDGKSFSNEDFQDFAEVAIDIIDMGISTALRFWAKDTSTAEYELPTDKKRRLTRQLANLFMKYQTKFSLEFMFVVTLLICYSVPVSKANKKRKLINSGAPAEEVKRGPGQPRKR